MNKETGGPAFPQPTNPGEYGRGMSLRDYFAAQALQGMLAEDGGGALDNHDLAAFAYGIADAMLEARK